MGGWLKAVSTALELCLKFEKSVEKLKQNKPALLFALTALGTTYPFTQTQIHDNWYNLEATTGRAENEMTDIVVCMLIRLLPFHFWWYNFKPHLSEVHFSLNVLLMTTKAVPSMMKQYLYLCDIHIYDWNPHSISLYFHL